MSQLNFRGRFMLHLTFLLKNYITIEMPQQRIRFCLSPRMFLQSSAHACPIRLCLFLFIDGLFTGHGLWNYSLYKTEISVMILDIRHKVLSAQESMQSSHGRFVWAEPIQIYVAKYSRMKSSNTSSQNKSSTNHKSYSLVHNRKTLPLPLHTFSHLPRFFAHSLSTSYFYIQFTTSNVVRPRDRTK